MIKHHFLSTGNVFKIFVLNYLNEIIILYFYEINAWNIIVIIILILIFVLILFHCKRYVDNGLIMGGVRTHIYLIKIYKFCNIEIYLYVYKIGSTSQLNPDNCLNSYSNYSLHYVVLGVWGGNRKKKNEADFVEEKSEQNIGFNCVNGNEWFTVTTVSGDVPRDGFVIVLVRMWLNS